MWMGRTSAQDGSRPVWPLTLPPRLLQCCCFQPPLACPGPSIRHGQPPPAFAASRVLGADYIHRRKLWADFDPKPPFEARDRARRRDRLCSHLDLLPTGPGNREGGLRHAETVSVSYAPTRSDMLPG